MLKTQGALFISCLALELVVIHWCFGSFDVLSRNNTVSTLRASYASEVHVALARSDESRRLILTYLRSLTNE